MVEVRRAETSDRASAAAALASAFTDDPLWRWMLAIDDGHEERLRLVFDALIAHATRAPDHLSYVDTDGRGAAVWRHPDAWKVAPLEMVRSAPAFIRALRFRLPASIRVLDAIEKVHPSEPHYYLEFLGTRRDAQSTGVGSALLAPMLDRCDDEGVPAYLESSNRENLAFYGRHGFVETRLIECGEAPPCTAMWRHPR